MGMDSKESSLAACPARLPWVTHAGQAARSSAAFAAHPAWLLMSPGAFRQDPRRRDRAASGPGRAASPIEAPVDVIGCFQAIGLDTRPWGCPSVTIVGGRKAIPCGSLAVSLAGMRHHTSRKAFDHGRVAVILLLLEFEES